MDILNIDDFAQPQRTLKLKGEDHPVQEVTVQDFIDNLAAAEKLEADGKDIPLSERMNDSVRAIRQSIPTLDEATIRALPLSAVGVIMKFIRGELDAQTTPVGAAPTAEGADAKKST
jgi:hypothetical protein